MEDGILTEEQEARLINLLAKSQEYIFWGLPKLDNDIEIKYFIATRKHLLDIYSFRSKNTKKNNLKAQLEWFVNNLNVTLEEKIRASFIGPSENRIIIFSDTDFNSLLGVISKDESEYSKNPK